MQLELLKTTVVVLAKEHNPTILHPAFLVSQGIVPQDWQLAEPPICTPPFSIVKYRNQIVFMVESQKFEVADNEPGGFIESEVPSLAMKYIRALPHVRYSAVGINLIGFAKCPNASAFLMERFLKTGPWIENSVQPEVVGLRLVYSIDGTRLRLSINPGKSKGPGSVNERDGILVDGNYHKELTSSNLLAEAEAAVSLFQQRCAHFMNFVKIIVGLEA